MNKLLEEHGTELVEALRRLEGAHRFLEQYPQAENMKEFADTIEAAIETLKKAPDHDE